MNMYTITELLDGGWESAVRVQDGVERIACSDRQKAIHETISAARVLNGSYIREDDIVFVKQPPEKQGMLSDGDFQLLAQIHRGVKVVLDYDNPLIKYRISENECEMIVKIREGELAVVEK